MLDLTLDDLRCIENLVIQHADTILLPFLNNTHANIKTDGSIVTEADLAMQQAIQQALAIKFESSVALLGEECSIAEQQSIMSNEQQFWVLDPLDGTTNFHYNFPVFCISLAFISNNVIQLGVIYDPIRKECFSALKGHGFFFNQQKSTINNQRVPTTIKDCIAFIDFKRLSKSQSINIITAMPFKSQRNIGSSALEWAWLAMNRVNISFHGGQKLWDYAAGCLLLDEAGGCSQSTDGCSLYQQSIAVRPIIAASSKQLCQLWSAEIEAHAEPQHN